MAFNPKDFIKNKQNKPESKSIGFSDTTPSSIDQDSPPKHTPTTTKQADSDTPKPSPSQEDTEPASDSRDTSSNHPNSTNEEPERNQSPELKSEDSSNDQDTTQAEQPASSSQTKSKKPNSDPQSSSPSPDSKNLPKSSSYRFYGNTIRFVLFNNEIYFVLKDVLPLGDLAPNDESLTQLQTSPDIQEKWDTLTKEIKFLNSEGKLAVEIFTTKDNFLTFTQHLPQEISGPFFSWLIKISNLIKE